MIYYPDRWLIVKLETDYPHYRVFATWSGGYLTGEHWKLSSGIKSISIKDDNYIFHNASGSQYHCNKNYYGTSLYGENVLADIKKSIKKTGGSIKILTEKEASFLIL
ncbi:hypothetical protein [Caudoviricetes sp.]|nr:hypothetical protein [Caudoviricetes sp.]